MLETGEVVVLVGVLLLGQDASIGVRRALLIGAEKQECLARAVGISDDDFWCDWLLHGRSLFYDPGAPPKRPRWSAEPSRRLRRR